MKDFYVEITEISSRVIRQRASSLQEAEKLVKKAYRNEEIILSSEDCKETTFNAYSVCTL